MLNDITKQPNAVISRLPDDDEGNKVFAEILIKADGTLDEDNPEAFGVDIEDSFNDLEFSTVVLALTEEEMSTMELASFDISDQRTGEPAIIFENIDLLNDIIPGLLATYNSSAGQTLQ